MDSIIVPKDAGEFSPKLIKLMSRIPSEYGRYISCSKGWYQLITDLDSEISKLAPNYIVLQVKEKFGTLRFYYALPEVDSVAELNTKFFPMSDSSDPAGDDQLDEYDAAHEVLVESDRYLHEMDERSVVELEIAELVHNAEAASASICESCSSPYGLMTSSGSWLRTSCFSCVAASEHLSFPILSGFSEKLEAGFPVEELFLWTELIDNSRKENLSNVHSLQRSIAKVRSVLADHEDSDLASAVLSILEED